MTLHEKQLAYAVLINFCCQLDSGGKYLPELETFCRKYRLEDLGTGPEMKRLIEGWWKE